MEVSGARMASNRLATIARHLSPTPSSLSFMVHMDKLLASFSLYAPNYRVWFKEREV
jgi:hypothetical protein